jgi:hypothetical protein
MVALLLDLGADPLAVDASGQPAASYATTPTTDRRAMEKIRGLTSMELLSAERGHRQPNIGMMDLVAVLALGEWETASRILSRSPGLIEPGGQAVGALHMMAKRNDLAAVKFLLDLGADPNSRWAHWDAEVTPLHLASSQGHADMVRLLLDKGADPRIHDSKHDSDAIGGAEFFRQPEIARLLKAHLEA